MVGGEGPSHLVVGHLNKPHGTRGEFFVWPLTDHPEGVFAPGVVLLLGDQDANEPNPDLPPLRIDAVRPFQRGFLVHFGGVDSRNQADLLRGRYLFQSVDALEPLAEGEVFYHQLLEMSVFLDDGEELGRVVEVFELTPSDLLEVHGPRGVIMVPFADHIIVDVDIEERRIVIDPPEGFLDI